MNQTRPNPQARRFLQWTLVVAFVAIPVVEIWMLVSVGGWLGLWPTLALLVLSGAVGAWLMQREGRRAWRALADAFGGGRLPSGRLADAALVLVGGILLMLPGFLTDLLGLVMLLPFTRPVVRRLLAFVLARNAARGGSTGPVVISGVTVDSPPTTAGSPLVIEGEVEKRA